MLEYVVPCENCKYYILIHEDDNGGFYSLKGEYRCSKYHNSLSPEFFCADGRLKEKDESTNCL